MRYNILVMKKNLFKTVLFAWVVAFGFSATAQQAGIANSVDNHNRGNAKLYVLGMEGTAHAKSVDSKMKTHEGVFAINTSFEGKYTEIIYDNTLIDLQYLIKNISLMGYAVSEYYEAPSTNGARGDQYNDDGTVNEENKEPRKIRE